MEGKSVEQIIQQALQTLTVPIQPQLFQRFQVKLAADDAKTQKKRLKKNLVEENDSVEKAQEKLNKLIEQLAKSYQNSGKQYIKMKQVHSRVEAGEIQKQKANKQKNMYEGLYNNFKKRYDDQIKNAEQVEKDEQAKRKLVIQQLQERIKTIQGKYQETGKNKIQKFKENETLKHELSKYEPHLIASESLAEAQLKKKQIEIQIQMTTLKQKIEMMSSFKNMREETQEKLKKSREIEEKVGRQLKKLGTKEDQHKISLARAHLVFEQYKKAFNVLKNTLPQKEREAHAAKEKVKKSQASLQELRKKIEGLDKDYQTHVDQLQMLKKLEVQLEKQLQE